MRIALLLACVLTVGGVCAADADNDIARLLAEAGPFASEEMVRALQDPALLPANGIHEPAFIWNRGVDLAVILPPAVRVGREILNLRDQGVQITDTFTVRRILNAAESWARFEQSPAHSAGWSAVTRAVDRSRRTAGEPVTLTSTTAAGAFAVSEISGTPTTEDNPGSGELWCCEKFRIYSIPGGYICVDEGSACEICRACGPGHPPTPIPRREGPQTRGFSNFARAGEEVF